MWLCCTQASLGASVVSVSNVVVRSMIPPLPAASTPPPSAFVPNGGPSVPQGSQGGGGGDGGSGGVSKAALIGGVVGGVVGGVLLLVVGLFAWRWYRQRGGLVHDSRQIVRVSACRVRIIQFCFFFSIIML